MKPYIFFDANKAHIVRNKIKSDGITGRWNDMYKVIINECDRIVKEEVVSNGKFSMLVMGNYIANLSVASCFCSDEEKKEKYVNKALDWANVACSIENWGDETFCNNDLQAAHLMLGFSMLLDCCSDALSPQDKEKITRRLLYQGRIMYRFTVSKNEPKFWRESWLQNHLWNCMLGLICAAFALKTQYDEVNTWINVVKEKIIDKTLPMFGTDGASHEGVYYWAYGMERLIAVLFLLERHINVDGLSRTPWFSKTADYCLYMMLPEVYWANSYGALHFADSDPGIPGYDYILRFLAVRYNKPEAQILADTLVKKGYASLSLPWLGLIWQDDEKCSTNPVYTAPLAKLFDDIGLVSARSSWGKDACVLGFHCGAPLGNNYKCTTDCGAGHVHPDINHISLFANGTSLLSDDRYPDIKRTFNHSTLTINGLGQFGDGDRWYKADRQLQFEKKPRITYFRQNKDAVIFEGDGTAAYPEETKLLQFLRLVAFYPYEKRLEVNDKIEQKGSKELVLRFWVDSADSITVENNKVIVKKAGVIMSLFSENDGDLYVESAQADTRSMQDTYIRHAICLRSCKESWAPRVIIQWG